jgi:hypothetical protein
MVEEELARAFIRVQTLRGPRATPNILALHGDRGGETMTVKGIVRFRFRVRDLFPPADPTAPAFIRLMAVTNDLDTLARLWLCSDAREPRTESEKNIVAAESNYLFRLACATAYEASNVFRDFRNILQEAGRLGEIDKLDGGGKSAFVLLDNMFRASQTDFERQGFGKIFVRERNTVFHYPEPKVFRRAVEDYHKDQEGLVLVAGVSAISRYVIADELQGGHTLKPLQTLDEFGELARAIAEISGKLRVVVDAWVLLQVKTHSSALVGQDADEIDVGRLWPGLGRYVK